jgi:exopolyphosphatase/guanosine-5'-triphosphate,3'-diphosphate pyrophosphatase
MLIAECTGSTRFFKALARRRVYTHLGEGFKGNEKGDLTEGAVERTAGAIKSFVASARKFGVDEFHAVSTGVSRRAVNKRYFLDSIKTKAGIDVEIISGRREAILTRMGVIYGSGRSGSDSRVIFDLGGATTEFIWGDESDLKIKSLPFGALVLTHDCVNSDPPGSDAVRAISDRVAAILDHGLSKEKKKLADILLTGSGGTATTLAAIINHLGVREITPERINGLVIELDRIEQLINRIKFLPVSGRQKIKGMEKGRAEVILAGALAVAGIMHFFNRMEMKVSYSDILEGILISFILGEENEE